MLKSENIDSFSFWGLQNMEKEDIKHLNKYREFILSEGIHWEILEVNSAL